MGLFGKKIEGKSARQWALKGYREYHSKGLYDLEIECYNKALKIEPDNPRVLNNKGVALIALERYEEAVNCLEQATKLNPNLEDPWYNLGRAVQGMGEFKRAVEAYDRAIYLNPHDQDAIEQRKICIEGISLQTLMRDGIEKND